jgi:polysaccharide export outer membrane protein
VDACAFFRWLNVRQISTITGIVGLILLVSMFQACAGGKPATSGAPGEMYERQELESFVDETGPSPTPDLEYYINVGDVLDVVFIYHKSLDAIDVPVRRDGRISLPYVGDVLAAGMKPMQLDSVLTVKFSEILREPSLSVIIKKEADQLVYVLGEVQQPGGYEYTDNISLVQAISLAGGFVEGAKPSNTVLIRREGAEKIVGIEIDVKAILNGVSIENDILLRRYDIVYVPKSKIQTVAEFAEQATKIIRLPMDVFLTGWQIRTLSANYEYFALRATVD